jgi:hypothetical protein
MHSPAALPAGAAGNRRIEMGTPCGTTDIDIDILTIHPNPNPVGEIWTKVTPHTWSTGVESDSANLGSSVPRRGNIWAWGHATPSAHSSGFVRPIRLVNSGVAAVFDL